MAYQDLPLSALIVNPANDRHGELENETAAIAQLFALREQHMKNLAKDLASKGEIFEPPLVYPKDGKFIVADGNRRTTCLKLITEPRRAPTVELQQYFQKLRTEWNGTLPDTIECRVEDDRDRVDDILFRRHTGVQSGIGQSTWDDRMKNNFVVRTGKHRGLNIADEVEKFLRQENLLPPQKIPRSNLNRLLSAESLRNRLGISVKKNSFEFIRNKKEALQALSRVASDLSNRKVTLDDIWDAESKLRYIDQLEREGILPTASSPSPKPKPTPMPGPTPPNPQPPSPKPPKPTVWPHLIPIVEHGITWTAQQHRVREIWEELQFKLELHQHPNAISVLLRVLLELGVEHYVKVRNVSAVHKNDKLALRISKVAQHMLDDGLIDNKYLGALKKLQQGDVIISMDTLNRYVHSPNFSVSPEHLKMLWGTLSDFIMLCLKAKT
ncbi:MULTISPECIES: hypothetical protein [unclassified Ruegeria]|uniref:hypothetical protein n=1 Tax=unclassified Ruegeria TaxID=2625375 RepID=UPI001489F30C|nr:MULTISPECIES: hypothetical protein [unclassified Ruegeria]NOC92905.1 hypothetical protein [Ruegeria sp. HKCCD6604]